MRAPHNTDAGPPISVCAPGSSPNHIAHGSADALREFVAECLNRTNFYSGMGADYATVSDDAGLDYSIRCAVASLKQAVDVSTMLEETKQQFQRACEARRSAGGSA